MVFRWIYETPNGFSDIMAISDGEVLTELHFVRAGSVGRCTPDGKVWALPIFRETRRWLDIYFSGRQPDFTPAYRIEELTPFRREVLDEMLKIPFGETMTYGDIAATIARRHGVTKMSAQAVGGAVGWNPICLIIPCHRVIGANRRLVGYGGGIENKIALLTLEGHNLTSS